MVATYEQRSYARHSFMDTVTIAAGASVSSAINLSGFAGGIIFLASGFEGVIHFEVSSDGTTFVPLDDRFNTPIAINPGNPTTEAKAIEIPDTVFGVRHIRIKTYTTTSRTTPDTQTTAQTITFLVSE